MENMKSDQQKGASQEPIQKKGTLTEQEGEMPPLKPFGKGDLSIPEVVNRLEDLVNFALECEKKPLREDLSFVDIYKQLQDVRKAIDLLNKDQKDLLALLSEATGGELDLNSIKLSDEDQKLFDKLQRLRSVCESAKERIHTRGQRAPEVEKIVEEKIEESLSTEKKKASHRKGKFRPLGGKEGWVRT